MKKCIICGISKVREEEFNKCRTTKDGLQNKCRECQNLLSKEHYKNNKEKYKEKGYKHKKSIRSYIRELKSNSKCVRCGENHPAVLDFHHIRNKKYKISNISKCGISLNKVKEEIRKCIILCANCHRIIHWEDKNLTSMSVSGKGE